MVKVVERVKPQTLRAEVGALFSHISYPQKSQIQSFSEDPKRVGQSEWLNEPVNLFSENHNGQWGVLGQSRRI